MAWHMPDRPEAQPIDPRLFGQGSMSGAVLTLYLSILACVWVLLTRWQVVNYFGPAWLWWAANVIAPYLGLGLGALAMLVGLLDRLFGGYFETHLGKGFVALVLAVLVLWPRYAPTGMLVYSATETLRSKERVLQCVYLRIDGSTETVTHYTGRFCPRYNWPN